MRQLPVGGYGPTARLPRKSDHPSINPSIQSVDRIGAHRRTTHQSNPPPFSACTQPHSMGKPNKQGKGGGGGGAKDKALKALGLKPKIKAVSHQWMMDGWIDGGDGMVRVGWVGPSVHRSVGRPVDWWVEPCEYCCAPARMGGPQLIDRPEYQTAMDLRYHTHPSIPSHPNPGQQAAAQGAGEGADASAGPAAAAVAAAAAAAGRGGGDGGERVRGGGWADDGQRQRERA